ncbi:DUF2190 family protein [Roseomonas chloroacetimidivorans]|uniref:DUF2190 family protein n=1 Tax=Roseomonas chloroacetimidivorans TaxID=1766656 RepID=UPI003C78DCEE
MNNFVQVGEQLRFTADVDRASGEAFVLGAYFLVSTTAVKTGEDGVGRRVGVVRLPKATGAVTQFQKVYWDATNKVVSTTATGNRLIGAATKAQASADTTVEVCLAGQPV